jgi:hypothetical protein
MDKFLPFLQITLPLMITFVASIWASSWMQNKRIEELSKRVDDLGSSLGNRVDDMGSSFGRRVDDMGHRISDMNASLCQRLDDIIARLGRIEELLSNHDRRISALETAKWR